MKNRLALYCFYDRDGIVDDYVIYFLRELRKTVSKICCVVNGKLTDKGRKALEKCSGEVIERANEGLDAGAYAFFVKSRYDEIKSYDELIFCNNSFFGPLYPLADVFSEMDRREKHYDFWGMTIHPRAEGVIHKSQKLPYVNEHIQSYFIVFTKKVTNSEVFINFFRNLPEIHEFYEAVCLYELEITRALAGAGFTYGSLVRNDGLPQANSTILYPDILIREKKFPFIKRKVFIEDYSVFFDIGRAENAERCLDYVREHTQYDEGLVWQHILRTEKMSVLRQNLNLCYIPDDSEVRLPQPSGLKAAAVCYLESPSDAEECVPFMGNAAGLADLYFVSGKKEALDAARKCSESLSLASAKFIPKPDRGGELSAWLIASAPLFGSYDCLCFVHGVKELHLRNAQMTHDCFRMFIGSMLFSGSYVRNVISLFESHPRLGLAVMPPLNFGPFYEKCGRMSPGTRDYLTDLLRALRIDAPFDETPVAPAGGMFWCRTAALRKIFSRRWSYEDLPEEPLPEDGTIAHALELLPPFSAQAAGYYSAWIDPKSAASACLNNLYWIERNLSAKLSCTYGASGLRQLLRNIGSVRKQLSFRKRSFMKRLRGTWDAFSYARRHKALKRALEKDHEEFLEFLSGRKDLWDAEYYLRENPDIAETGLTPLEHYMSKGWLENRNPSEGLRTNVYLRVNPDCRLLGVSPLEHYYVCSRKRKVFRSYGELRDYLSRNGVLILKISPRFDPEYYTERCRRKHGFLPDGFEPYSYYLEHGSEESVKPGPRFRVHRYFHLFPDIVTYGICPVAHYELIGRYV